MKTLLLAGIVLVFSLIVIEARSRITSSTNACNFVEVFLWDEFVSKKKKLPSTWEEFDFVSRFNNNPKDYQLELMEKINDLAIVPNAPMVKQEQGINLSLSDLRLFAIARVKSYDYPDRADTDDSPQGGRHAILVSESSSSVITHWIPEPEVKVILRQMGNFDPTIQPMAFTNLSQISEKIISDKDREERKFQEELAKIARAKSWWRSIDFRASWVPWLLGSLIAVGLGIWRATRSR